MSSEEGKDEMIAVYNDLLGLPSDVRLLLWAQYFNGALEAEDCHALALTFRQMQEIHVYGS